MSRFAEGFFQHAERLASEGESFAVVTWIGSAGHAPQDLGAKAIVTRRGLYWGTVGGGKVEAKAIAACQELLLAIPLSTAPRLLHWDLQRDVGMSCGGSVDLIFETFPARTWSVNIFGAGHVAQALVRALALLDCHVTCIDTRIEWVDRLPPESSSFKKMLVDNLSLFASDLPPSTYCVLVTQGHAHDVPVLKKLVGRRDLSYIGVIGSSVKARKIRAELIADGFNEESSRNFECPMGIGFRSHQPTEIAVSIMAQLLVLKNQN